MLRLSGLVIVFLLTAAAAPAADLAESENLFFIKRSKNANEVHYDARVEGCAWREPAVDSYWRDLADGPHVYEEIGWWEDGAYGFDVARVGDSQTEITITLKALPEKAITARLSKTDDGGCRVATTIEIGGKPAQFRSVYVFATENFIGWPTVHYVDILGTAEDGQPVFERVARTDLGRKQGAAPPDPSLWQSGITTWGRR